MKMSDKHELNDDAWEEKDPNDAPLPKADADAGADTEDESVLANSSAARRAGRSRSPSATRRATPRSAVSSGSIRRRI